MIEELGYEILIDVGQTLVGLPHPHRQVDHHRLATAYVAGSVAAIDKVLAVRLYVSLQLSAAAGTA